MTNGNMKTILQRRNIMTVKVFTPDTFGVLDDEQIQYQQLLIRTFESTVEEIKTLLVEKKIIAHVPVSQGKDSTVVEIIVIEAYRRAIAEGVIESDRPLILSTVDTLNESIPMKMYPTFAKRRIEAYAKEQGINMYYDMVTPGLNDEYFVKFTGGQKLVPNASRRGDCSIILKVEPSESYVRTMRERFRSIEGMQHYAETTVVTFVGSRTDEGVRRSNNMNKQGLRSKQMSDLIAEIDKVNALSSKNTGRGKKTPPLIKFAPIKQWSTDNVFDFLRLAGSRPVTRMLDGTRAPVPTFFEHFALLLEIYGNGSNDVCEVVVGSTKQGSGCNGKARYGCWNCTMVATTDHSSTALTQYPRWRALGAEDALRVRDFLYRLSCDMDARAFHARAFDPAGYNRVALQPNVLKPKHLEKMVRFASQLTVDSKRKADAFAMLVAQGREMEHEGYRDIYEDTMIPPKAKKAFLEMYKECAQEPVFTSFSREHALLLSYRWSIDGIGAAPYRPLAIWEQTVKGEGRIPYPMLNSEYEARFGQIKMIDKSKPLPDALMVPVYRNEDPALFAKAPDDLYALWQRPNDSSDVMEEDRNCTLERVAKHEAVFAADVHFDVEVTRQASAIKVHCNGVQVKNAKMGDKALKPGALASLMSQGVKDEIDALYTRLVERMDDEIDAQDDDARFAALKKQVSSLFSKPLPLRRRIPHLRELALDGGFQASGRKVKKKINFTKRVGKMGKNGKMEKRNTRLAFYSPQNTSSLYDAHVGNLSVLVPDFSGNLQKYIRVNDMSEQENDYFGAVENLDIDREAYREWEAMGGVQAAIAEHDDFLRTRIKKRHVRGYRAKDLRAYGGTHVAEAMMASGPIAVKKGYWSKLEKILKRTQIFDALGLFRFQSSNYEDIRRTPGIVTMDQHRKDKAEIVSSLRNERSATRRQAQKALSLIAAGRYGAAVVESLRANLSMLTPVIDTAINTMVNRRLAEESKRHFHMGEVSLSRQSKMYRFWLLWFFEGITDVDGFMRKLLNNNQWSLLTADPKAYCAAVEACQHAIAGVRALMRQVDYDWSPVSAFLEQNLTCKDNVSVADYREEIRTGLRSLIPAELCDHDGLNSWRPSQEFAERYVSSLKESIDNALTVVQKVESVAESVHIARGRMATSGEKQLALL